MLTGTASALLALSWHHVWVTVIDPLHGDGYQWWSGLGSDLVYLSGVAAFMHHHNCRISGCWRPGHIDPESGQLYCHKHRPQPKE